MIAWLETGLPWSGFVRAGLGRLNPTLEKMTVKLMCYGYVPVNRTIIANSMVE
ncbi:MAG TPA: hypothetical protein VIJ16_11830 [Gemmatimonadaceae bacterium]